MIDLQIPLDGPEIIEIAPTSQLTPATDYESDTDLIFSPSQTQAVTQLYVQPGEVVVLYPEDAHKPGKVPTTDAHAAFRKLVFKVALSATQP